MPSLVASNMPRRTNDASDPDDESEAASDPRMTGRAARAVARREPEGPAEVAETEARSGEVGAVTIQEATATPRANELNEDGEVEEPEELLCPITKVMMRDPVFVAGSGNTYEREAIETFWQHSR